MGQPIRKKIQEVHPDLIKEPPFRTLLVDGGSLLFNSFGNLTMNSDGVIVGPIKQFLTQIRTQLEKAEFEYVYVFFDDEYSGWLRWNLYNYYKANRDKYYDEYYQSDYGKLFNEVLKSKQNYIYSKKLREAKSYSGRYYKMPKPNGEVKFKVLEEHDETLTVNYVIRYNGKRESIRGTKDTEISKIKGKAEEIREREFKYFAQNDLEYLISENFDRCRDILCLIFNELYIRWNMDEIVEGDDFIAYYCKHKKENEKIVIISGDMDLSQLIADDICIYNLNLKKYITPSNFTSTFGYYYENTAVKKILCGDVSDNISNIKGLSENALMELMPELKTKKVTIEDVKNRAQQLIDERISKKKKPLQVHQNIVNGVSNKKYDGDFYEINEKIIDLHNPLLTKEAEETIESMMYAPQDPEGRSIQNLYRIILDQNIEELRSDTQFSSFFRPFKKLEEKERKRYNEN